MADAPFGHLSQFVLPCITPPHANPAASSLTWQLAVSNIDTAIATCQRAGLNFEVAVERPRDDWTYRTIKLRSPNGMEVLLEEQTPQP